MAATVEAYQKVLGKLLSLRDQILPVQKTVAKGAAGLTECVSGAVKAYKP